MLSLEKLEATALVTDPYEYVIVEGFIKDDKAGGIMCDYPKIKKGGSFPLSEVSYGPEFERLIDEMNGDAFRAAVERKFNVDLTDKPTMFTVRGQCRDKRDGQIHTDSETKIITVLLYMNHAWENQGGKLRVLRSNNIEDVAAEVPPVLGTLLIFKRSNHSWHGHKSFTGDRKVIQMNWVTDHGVVEYEQGRHRRSSWLKNLFSPSY